MAEEHSQHVGTPRLLLLAEVFTRAVALSAVRRSLAVYAGIGIVAAVLFAPNAMSAADVTEAAEVVWFRLGLWVTWLVVMATPCRIIVDARGTEYLRALPLPRSYFWAAQLVWLGLLQAPWAWLWLRGAGPVAALSATTLVVAAQVAMAARPRHPGEVLAKVSIVAGVLGVVGFAPAWAGPVGGVLLLVMVPAAWKRSVQGSANGLGFPIAGPAGLALALVQGVLIWRRQRAALVRAVIVVGVGAAATALAARANGIAGAGARELSLAIASLTLLVVVGGLAVAVLERERELRWLLDSSGTSGRVRVVASVASVAAIAGLLGAGHGIAVAWALEVEVTALLRLAAVALAAGVALAAIAVAAARYAERADGVDGTRVVSALIVLAIAAVLLTGLIGELVVVVLFALGSGLAVASTEIACAPQQRWRRRR